MIEKKSLEERRKLYLSSDILLLGEKSVLSRLAFLLLAHIFMEFFGC
jgi:hypothetical protein